MVTLLLEAPAKNGEANVSTWSLLKCIGVAQPSNS